MEDLISRQSVIEMLTEIETNNWFPTLATLKQRVSDIPTAYDVDKVVEQLEKSIQISKSSKAEAIAGMCGASAYYYHGGAECAYEKAIKLVKGGSVDGN